MDQAAGGYRPRAIWALLGVGVALLVFFALLFTLTGDKPTDEKPDSFVSSRDADLKTVAQSVLAAVQLGRVESLYLLMSSPTRQNLSLTALESDFAKWLPEATANGDLRSRTVLSVDQAQATATIGTAGDSSAHRSRANTWTWHFVKENSGWKLARCDGGPALGDALKY